MNEKFNSEVFKPLSEKEQNEVNGGFLLLVFTALSVAQATVIGTAIYGAYQMGYDRACGC